MTVLSLCEEVMEEWRGRPATFSSVDLGRDQDGELIITDPESRRVVRAVLDSIRDVLNYSSHWEFYNQRGLLWHLYSGKETYHRPEFDSIEWDSLYLTETGSSSTAQYPIRRMQYDEWQRIRQYEQQSNGLPLWLAEGPDSQWTFWPVPSADYSLYGNAQLVPVDYSDSSCDLPWDESRFNRLFAWLAVKKLEERVKAADEIVPQRNAQGATSAMQALWDRFLARYKGQIR